MMSPGLFSCHRLLQLPLSTVLYACLYVYVCFTLFFHAGQRSFPHIPRDEIEKALYKVRNPNLAVDPKKPLCDFNVLQSTRTLYGHGVPRVDAARFAPTGIANGSHAPTHCTPQLSVAVLVTYRNRQRHWDVFLPYMHDFLRRQNIHYKIFLIEQVDSGPWNKGVLYNVGARLAMAEGWPCLLLHDVDLLPLDEGNLAACTLLPRHLSGQVDTMRYVLPYPHLVGGVAAVRADQYTLVNGFSNNFLFWGGEDDNFALRLKNAGLDICRFPPSLTRYSMLRHRPAAASGSRHVQAAREAAGGLRDAAPRGLRVTAHRLFVRLAVTVDARRPVGSGTS